MNTTLLQHEGDAHSTNAGDYSVNVIHNGTAAGLHLYRVTVTRPGFVPQPAFDREHDRPFGHTDQTQAQKIAEHYAAGVVDLLTFEAQGIPDERIAEVASGVDATMRQVENEITAVMQAEQDDAQAIAGDRTGWASFRHQVREQATQTAAKASEPMERILTEAASNGGRIVRAKEATSTQLIALRKRGLVELTYGRRGNQRVIVGARLTGKGWKHAGVERNGVAA